MWTFKCYKATDADLCPWQEWYDANPDFQGSHDAVLDVLEDLTIWPMGYVDFLDKNNRIVEIRLHGRIKHRILGYHSVAQQEFTILGFCYHKQKVYYPHGIKETVVRRKKAIENGTGKAVACERPKSAQ